MPYTGKSLMFFVAFMICVVPYMSGQNPGVKTLEERASQFYDRCEWMSSRGAYTTLDQRAWECVAVLGAQRVFAADGGG